MGELALPPVEMRRLVGPTDEAFFDNPSGDPAYGDLVDAALYDSVFDFGCGCGRNARRLLQQHRPPRRYLGIDLHRGMVDWCRANLAPPGSGFDYEHHDVFNAGLNPAGSRAPLPFPTDEQFTLVLAHSVFTHVLPASVEHDLGEVARLLAPGGRAVATWFFFDKRYFPMMQDFQNALFINVDDPTNAVLYDRDWFGGALARAGLVLAGATPPPIRGFQWMTVLARREDAEGIELPADDDAPFGVVRAAADIADPHRIGRLDAPV